MRVPGFSARLLLGGALLATTVPVTAPVRADTAKITCPCECPQNRKAKPRHAEIKPRQPARHYAGSPYRYRDAMPVHWRDVTWQMVPGSAEPQGLVIDQAGWSGGVGYGAEGEGGGGYGQVLLVNGAGQNGPTYNSLGESFQSNPSTAHPFQNRLMGGIAPAK